MIYDYNTCETILDNFQNSNIKEKNAIGYSSLEHLPIRHFTLGNGEKQVVITGSWHSNEIISTTFVIELMKYLNKNNIIFENATIHFIPILNPEGYIINTSAIRNKINKNATENEVKNFCYEYYKNYKIDATINENSKKLHQEMFNNTNYNCIDKKYGILRTYTDEILKMHPKGSIIDWAANGKGIDLNSNSVNKIVYPFEYNKQKQINNIRLDIPSPIGYPGENKYNSFHEENEISSLKKLFYNLNKDNNFIAYFNYHSIGGLIYQRPEKDNKFFETYNYLLSKFYQEYTIKNQSTYDIIKEKANKITSVNDNLRITYPGNLLIELSPMMGNPIGVYGDNINVKNTIESNIISLIYTLDNLIYIYNKAKEISNNFTNINELYNIIDNEYIDIKKRKLKRY